MIPSGAMICLFCTSFRALCVALTTVSLLLPLLLQIWSCNLKANQRFRLDFLPTTLRSAAMRRSATTRRSAATACFESCCRVPCEFYLYAHVCWTTPLMFCSLGVTFPCQVTDLLQEWDWGNVEDSGYWRAMC
jgi:hypothetical protein